MIDKNRIENAFLHNRAEELPDDVWGTFVIPKHFHTNNLIGATKSRVIVGGRGCGKTMFIRYFCHPTRFSKKRTEIDLIELNHIGLYWRPHTQFCSLFSDNWLGDQARPAFLHYFSLILITEFIQSLKNIAASACNVFDEQVLEIQSPNYFKKVIPEFKDGAYTLEDLYEHCIDELDVLETWVNRPVSELPYNLIPTSSLNSLIRAIQKIYPEFQDTIFQVYIDEFENLQEEQQRLINDLMKHGRKPLIFSVAMKKYAKVATQTSGEEHVVGRQDYVKIDLEESLTEEDFKILAAEITLLRLYDAGAMKLPSGVDNDYFINPNRLIDKRNQNTNNLILEEVSKIFPKPSMEDICSEVIEDKSLRNSLVENIRKGLALHKEEKIKPEEFLATDSKVAIVASAVVNRNSITPSEVLSEIEKYNNGEESRFSGDGGWIKNTLNGVIFLIYKKFPKRHCPLYSGFSKYCKISRKNIRHFQEMFKECVIEYPSDIVEELVFNSDLQAKAAAKASNALLGEVVRFGNCGEQLLGFIKRLGFLFELSHKRLAQSEIEVNHFSLGESDESRLSDNAKIILQEAKRWSVLFEEEDATKAKSKSEVATSDYILNPVYAPRFGISTRKNRKITILTPDLETLIQGDTEEWKIVVNKYLSKWGNVSEETPQGQLF